MTKISTQSLVEFCNSTNDPDNKCQVETHECTHHLHAVLYHSNCHDGIVAASIMNIANIIKEKEHRSNMIYVAVQYGEEPPMLPSDTSLITVVDFSFDELVIANAYPGVKVVQLDHHDTAYKRLKGYCNCKPLLITEHIEHKHIEGVICDADKSVEVSTTIDIRYSGAGLAQRHIEAMPKYMYEDDDVSKNLILVCAEFAKYAQDRDLWKYEFGRTTKAFRLLINKEVGKNHVGDMTSLMLSIPIFYTRGTVINAQTYIYEQVLKKIQPYMGIVEYEENRIDNLAQRVDKFTDEQGRLAALCAYTGKDASDVGGRIMEVHKDISYVVMYVLSHKGAFLSFRSLDGSAQVVAESMGGGGHPNAAGAKVDGSIIYDKYFGLIREYQAKLKESKKKE